MARPRKQASTEAEERHLNSVRAASVARAATFKRLREAHPEEWEEWYAEEAEKVGVVPRTQRYRKEREELLAKLARLDALEQKARGRMAPSPKRKRASNGR
jgi:hypothetical protein